MKYIDRLSDRYTGKDRYIHKYINRQTHIDNRERKKERERIHK